MAFELKILTDLSAMPKVVETNIDEVTPVIDAAIERVKNLEVTENKDEIIAADADAAKLTKMADAIKRFRIDHIALWKEPMAAFEKKCKDAETRLFNAATDIRTKTGEVKELWRSRKLAKCKELWDKTIGEAFAGQNDVIQSGGLQAFFDLWTNPKTKGTWINSSVSESSILKAIHEKVESVRASLEAVKANYAGQSEEVQAKARYALLKSFDMNDVIREVNLWNEEQKRIACAAEAERKRKAEAEAAEAAARSAATTTAAMAHAEPKEVPTHTPVAPAQVPAAPVAETPVSPVNPIETYRLEICGTRENLTKLREYGISIGITFKNLEK